MKKFHTLKFRPVLRLGVSVAIGVFCSHTLLDMLGVVNNNALIFSANYNWHWGELDAIFLALSMSISYFVLGKTTFLKTGSCRNAGKGNMDAPNLGSHFISGGTMPMRRLPIFAALSLLAVQASAEEMLIAGRVELVLLVARRRKRQCVAQGVAGALSCGR